MDFEDVYGGMAGRILRFSKSQRIPGLSPDEVRAEMLEVLWRAVMTYDISVGTTVEQYWWQCWIRKKRDLLEAHYAKKRQMLVITEPDTLVGIASGSADRTVPIPPVSILDTTQRAVWFMLAVGYTGEEVRSVLRIGKTRYYDIIESFRRILETQPEILREAI